MAITHTETRVQFSSSDSTSISSGSNATSDAVTVDATCFQASMTLKADNGGTPAGGDTVDVWLLGSAGDPDGTGTHEYATTEQGLFLGTLDTNADDPAIRTVDIPMPLQNLKVYAVNNASSNSITFSAVLLEQRG